MPFYDELAGQYNDIVDEARRVSSAEDFAGWLVRTRGARKVLDVACGTGLHTAAMAKLGAEVTAADISPEMLKQAKCNAGVLAEAIQWRQSAMENLAEVTNGPFDAILCLGNSLPHLLTEEQLHSAVENFKKRLAPSGVVVIQILNYHRILERRERIVGVTRVGDVEYVRFYDFLDGRIRFNILRLEWRDDGCDHQLYQTTLRPYRSEELIQAFTAAGFQPPMVYGDLRRQTFDPAASECLVLLATP